MTTDGTRPRVADLLRRYPLVAGLSQAALAERAGLSERGVSNLERGISRAPHPHTLGLLAEALGLGATERLELLAAARPALAPDVQSGMDDAVCSPETVGFSRASSTALSVACAIWLSCGGCSAKRH